MPTEETVKLNTTGLDPSPARPAANMPIVQGVCPACNARSLFLAVGGHITCWMLACPDPCLAAKTLRDV